MPRHHYNLPLDDDEPPFDFTDLDEEFSGFDEAERMADEISSGDPDSVENVLERLERFDQDLQAAGQIDGDAIEANRYAPENIDEFNERARDELAAMLRSVWGRLGAKEVEYLTGQDLAEIDSEALEDLNDEIRAECLYFDTATKAWKKLGSEPVTVSKLLAQVDPKNKPSRPTKRVKLEELQESLQAEAARLLQGIKVDSHQLLAMTLGTATQKQNIVRLAFVLREEPALRNTRRYLLGKDEEEERPEIISIDEIINRSLADIEAHMQNYMIDRAEQGAKSGWEAIDYEQYNRAMHHAYNSLKLIERIQKDMHA